MAHNTDTELDADELQEAVQTRRSQELGGLPLEMLLDHARRIGCRLYQGQTPAQIVWTIVSHETEIGL